MKNNNLLSRLKTSFIIPAVAGLGALLAPPAEAVEAILAVDAYVSASQPAANFGTAETLPVGNGNRALLRFDLGSILPVGTASDQVAKAVLNVWVNGVTKSGSVEVSELLGSWTEPGVTGATLPSVGPAFATKAVSTAGRWVPIVVTSQVKKWLSTPSANNGLLIAPAASAPNTAVSLDSKENTATSHPARLEIELAGTLGGSYTLIVGKTANDNTGRTQLSVPDFTTITAALNKIPNVYNIGGSGAGACSARYLVKVLPGIYNERVTMKPCVDIEGSGELTTKITATGGNDEDNLVTTDPAGGAAGTDATVIGASQAELRSLTVENTGGANYSVGIFNMGESLRLSSVTVTAGESSYRSYGVYNFYFATLTMTNATVTATGGRLGSYGVFNYHDSSLAMTNVDTRATSSGSTTAGVWNSDSSSASIERSSLHGVNGQSIRNYLSSTAQVGASQLDGLASGAVCGASYNASFVMLNASCQ